MSLSTNSKQQSSQPLFYQHGYDQNDLKVKLDKKLSIAEGTLSDLLISGFFRSILKNIKYLPMLIVDITTKMFTKNHHLPYMISKLIPMNVIFNGCVMNLKTPKWSNLDNASRIVLRLFLQWRQNIIFKSSLNNIILSGNDTYFGNEGCYWLKQVLPYHPELKELTVNNCDISNNGLKLIVQSLTLRHDNLETQFPIKLLEKIDLSNNKFGDKYISDLLTRIYIYTPFINEINLSSNNLTTKSCYSICEYLEKIDNKHKKQRYLKKIILRHNEIDYEGAKEINEILEICHFSFKVKIELGSNPTKKPYSFDDGETPEWDPRINLFGT